MDSGEIISFNVFDMKTSEIADLEKLQKESWIDESITGNLTGFLVGKDRSLYLMDENSNIIECNPARFKVKFETFSDLKYDAKHHAETVYNAIAENEWEKALECSKEIDVGLRKISIAQKKIEQQYQEDEWD